MIILCFFYFLSVSWIFIGFRARTDACATKCFTVSTTALARSAGLMCVGWGEGVDDDGRIGLVEWVIACKRALVGASIILLHLVFYRLGSERGRSRRSGLHVSSDG